MYHLCYVAYVANILKTGRTALGVLLIIEIYERVSSEYRKYSYFSLVLDKNRKSV